MSMRKIDGEPRELREYSYNGIVGGYYARFRSWDGQEINKSLGTKDIHAARTQLKKLLMQNELKQTIETGEEREIREAKKLRAQQEQKRRRGITFGEFTKKYFDDIVYPEDERPRLQHLGRTQAQNHYQCAAQATRENQ